MSIWEKIIGKKKEGLNIEEEIGKINQMIAELGRRRKQLLDESMTKGRDEGFRGTIYEPPEKQQIERIDREVMGLRDKLALLKEKQRREGEKVGELTK